MDNLAVALILAREVLGMFLLIGVGVVARKARIVGADVAKALCNLLLMIVVPFMLIHNLQTDKRPEIMGGMFALTVLAFLFHAITCPLANLLIRDPGNGDTRYRVDRLCAVFTNSGFMGIPLLQATYGDDGALYCAMYVGVFNVVSWIYGPSTLTGSRSLKPRQLVLNPGFLGFAAALVLFLAGIRLPGLLGNFVGQVGGVNTTLSMMCIGVFLCDVKVREAVRDPAVYRVVLIRNILFPLLTVALLWITRAPRWIAGGSTLCKAFIIMISCSTAASGILMPARYGADSSHGAKLVSASTCFAILTMPLMAYLAELLL